MAWIVSGASYSASRSSPPCDSMRFMLKARPTRRLVRRARAGRGFVASSSGRQPVAERGRPEDRQDRRVVIEADGARRGEEGAVVREARDRRRAEKPDLTVGADAEVERGGVSKRERREREAREISHALARGRGEARRGQALDHARVDVGEAVVEDVVPARIGGIDDRLDRAAAAAAPRRERRARRCPAGIARRAPRRGTSRADRRARAPSAIGSSATFSGPMPLLEPSKFGFAITGNGSSSSPPVFSVARVTNRPRGLGTPQPASCFLVSALSSVTQSVYASLPVDGRPSSSKSAG